MAHFVIAKGSAEKNSGVMRCPKKMGASRNRWFKWKIHPIKMDEKLNWGNYLYFGKPPYQWIKLMI